MKMLHSLRRNIGRAAESRTQQGVLIMACGGTAIKATREALLDASDRDRERVRVVYLDTDRNPGFQDARTGRQSR